MSASPNSSSLAKAELKLSSRFLRHGEEQERLDLGRYTNLQQIHDLMAAKGFKRSLAWGTAFGPL